MKSIDALKKKNNVAESPTYFDKVSKKVLFSKLANISIGHLTIEHQGEVFSFGAAKDQAEIIAHINIRNSRAYQNIVCGGTIGAGKSFIEHLWTSPDLVSVIRLIAANQHVLDNLDTVWGRVGKSLSVIPEFFRRNSKSGSQKNIAAHYDLSNDFFSLFLDPTMMYSSAIFPSKTASLHEASVFKLHHICERLDLQPADHLLEIGSGWGGMAIYAAKHFGCKVTTTTISERQYQFALEKVKQEGLEDQVFVIKKDYRDLTGLYDKIVSIEMIEAVGHQYYKQFFSQCNRLLTEDGAMLIQAITTQDQRFRDEKNKADFIRYYIFPGGCLPSNEAVCQSSSAFTNMHLIGLDDITLDYARTLAEWKKAFFDSITEVKSLGFDEYFIRMWDFYLSYCEGGFSERVISTSQFLFAKPRFKKLPKLYSRTRS